MPKEVGGEKNQRLVTARPQGRWVRRREERRLSYSYGGRKETWYPWSPAKVGREVRGQTEGLTQPSLRAEMQTC